ncbi:MAG: UDP-N-acetylmuramoyl-tripeptide--D-alanyl-D-alanine ligase [Dehalococcoidia bacterium]|nr:UDP-N-acetylmuramoyl-tripeptide--D-alanyl-D-alanine ligase [Dehalococcoidia bacterium]
MLTAAGVALALGSTVLGPAIGFPQALRFSRVVVDSREAAPGVLFVALPGARTDGHRFIADAIARGATGILARDWPSDVPLEHRTAVLFPVGDPLAALQQLARRHRDESALRLIAVTGSVGKTSTKDAVAGVLGRRYRVLKSDGNRNTEIGLPLTLLEIEAEHERAVLEMGMYQIGDIAQLCGIAHPQVGVVTNVGPTHLARLGSIERIAAAKAEMVECLPSDGTAVLNIDDPVVARFSERTAASVVTYGLAATAHCRATGIESAGLDGLRFTLSWRGETIAVQTPLQGRHHVWTALAAAAVGFGEGLSVAEVASGLKGLTSVNRLRVRRGMNGAALLDDSYNASPASMKAALDLLSETPGRHIAVLGDMLELGSEEEPGHREVGRHAARRADCLVAVGERAAWIAEAARAAGMTCVRHFLSRNEARASLRSRLGPRQHVLIKGSRGMALDLLADDLSEA